MTQEEKVLKHIKKNGYITSWDAIMQYKITRISARIWNLRQDGFDIKMKMLVNPKTKSCYGVYYLKDKEIKKYERLLQNM